MKTLISKTCNIIIYDKKYEQSGCIIAKNLRCNKMAIYNLFK